METLKERLHERSAWSDERLTTELAKAAVNERGALVELLLNLIEFDRRSLSQKGAYSSLFDYCTRKLGYSSSEAGRRIAVARKAVAFPLLLAMLERGELHLSGASMLTGLLTGENYMAVLGRAKGRTQDEIARLAAILAPKSAPTDSIRILRAPTAAPGLNPPPALAADSTAPRGNASAPADIKAPLSDADLFGISIKQEAPEVVEELYAVTFSARKETRDMIERAKEVLRHRFPQARIDEIINLALKKLLASVDRDLRKPFKQGKSQTEAPEHGRYIPESVKQEAWERDGGRCAFVGPDGTRCTARSWLEFDHAIAYALGGSSIDSANVRPYCRPHNAWAGKQAFGVRRRYNNANQVTPIDGR
jgi:hypothetical protein